MLPFPKISPTLLEIGPVKLRCYGVMYVLGFVASYFLISRQRKARTLGFHGDRLQELALYLAVGLIVGARLGYILFYQFSKLGDYLMNPLQMILVIMVCVLTR